MDMLWCYTRDGRTTNGPVSWRELRRMAASGRLLPTDVVGPIGMKRSVRAGDVPGLFGGRPSPAGRAKVETAAV